MTYVKTTWVDQNVERPKTYEMSTNSDGSVTLIDSFGLVEELGTPVNAVNMNHIEYGIADHEERITELEEKTADIATTEAPGIVQPDGTTITITTEGIISAQGGANTDLSNLTSAGNAKFQYAPFSINNGSTDSNGQNATLQTVGDIPVEVDKYVVPVLSSNNSEYGTCNDYTMTGSRSSSWSNFTTPWVMQLSENNYIPAGAVVTFTISTYNVASQFESGKYRSLGCRGCKIEYTYTDDTTEVIFDELLSGDFASWTLSAGNKSAVITLPAASKKIKTISLTGYENTASNMWYAYYNAWGITFRAKYIVSSADTLICNPCTITTADSKTNSFDTTSLLDCSNVSDGTYKIMKSYQDGSLSLLSNLTISKTEPSSPVNDNLWLDTSKYPLTLKEYASSESEWTVNNNLVYIGDVTIKNGLITSIKNNYFNACPARRDLVDSYVNGSSWYAIYSDGWCEQGSNYTGVNDTYTTLTITLLKPYKNNKYTVLALDSISTTKYAQNTTITSKSAKGFTLQLTINYNGYGNWYTCGYIN